jgi:hypothetical protein
MNSNELNTKISEQLNWIHKLEAQNEKLKNTKAAVPTVITIDMGFVPKWFGDTDQERLDKAVEYAEKGFVVINSKQK